MPFGKLKRKRDEKRKRGQLTIGLLIGLCTILLFAAGATLYVVQQVDPEPTPTPGMPAAPVPTEPPIEIFANTCALTDGYHIKINRSQGYNAQPYRQVIDTTNEQYRLTVNEAGVFLGSPDEPQKQRLFDAGTLFTIHASPDNRYFGLFGDTGLFIVTNATGEVQLLSERATYFDSWSPNGEYVIYREDASFIMGYTSNGRVRALPPQYGYVTEFHWSPNSRYLAVYYNRMAQQRSCSYLRY